MSEVLVRSHSKMLTRGDSVGKKKVVDHRNPGNHHHSFEEELVCVGFAMSAAQAAYQRDSSREEPESGIYFFKDATPKSEHFVEFRVELPSRFYRGDIPLVLELVSLPSGVADYGRAEIFPEQEYLKAVTPSARNQRDAPSTPPSPVVGAVLRYRVEVGSYRQGDRRFAIRAAIDPTCIPANPALASVVPCYTPPIYVASKVKRPASQHRPHAHGHGHAAEQKATIGRPDAPSGGATVVDRPLSAAGTDETPEEVISVTAPTLGTPPASKRHRPEQAPPGGGGLLAQQQQQQRRDSPPPLEERQQQRPPSGEQQLLEDAEAETSTNGGGHQRPEEPPSYFFGLDEVHARLAALEDAVVTQIVPALRRIEQRLSGADLSFQQMLAGTDSQDAADAPPQRMASFTFDRTNSDIFDSKYLGAAAAVAGNDSFAENNDDPATRGGYWADSMTTMGNGIQEGMDALDAIVVPADKKAAAAAQETKQEE